MTRLTLLPLAVAAAIAVGCGEADSGDEGAGAESAPTATAVTTTAGEGAARTQRVATETASGVRIKVVDSEYGKAIADGTGEALYLFDKEGGRRAKCYGTCASVWPPVLTAGQPSAGIGAEANLLGTVKRANGKHQVTYAGHPLYYYVGDSPGAILCHDVFEFGGTWLVVGPSGEAVG